MRASLCCALLLIACKQRAPAPLDPKEQFRADVSKAVLSLAPDASISWDAAHDAIVIDGTEVSFGNLYPASQRSPQARADVIANIARTSLRRGRLTPETWAEAAPNVLPRVRGAANHTTERLVWQLKSDAGFPEPVELALGHLRVSLVYDMPDSVQFVSEPLLAGWGVDRDTALKRALENFAKLPAPKLVQRGPFWSVENGDNYDAARLLLTPHFSSLELAGRPVAIVCGRDALYIAGEKNPGALLAALEACAQFEGGYPIAYEPMVLDHEKWTSWAPPPGRFALRVAELAKVDHRDIYTEQRKLLDQYVEENDLDLFFSSPILSTAPDGGALRSSSTWPDGLHGWLARTDDIVFVHIEDDGGYWARMAGFDDAQRVLGGAMKPVVGYDPPWFEVDGWPTKKQLDAMHATARVDSPR